MFKIVDKTTLSFIRVDSNFDDETEIALDLELRETQEPSLEERIQALEVMELERILGVVF